LSTARPDGLPARTTYGRDLASAEIWQRSLARSRQRRRLAEIGRRARRKRKSVSLAVSAALAAGPVVARGVAVADSGSGSTRAGSAETAANGLLTASGERIVLQTGSEGALVAAAQRRLNEVLPLTHLAVDGDFGSLTRSAVLQFQRSHGLPVSGAVDVLTWAAMFKAPVLVMGGAGATGSAAGGSGEEESTTAGSVTGEGSTQSAATGANATARAAAVQPTTTPAAGAEEGGAGAVPAAETSAGSNAPGSGAALGAGSTTGSEEAPSAPPAPSTNGTNSGQPLAVVAPTSRTTQPSTYVLTNGVALPLPRQYISNGSVDQGVDYAAPGGTPLYAMGEGVIIGEGISGFGPNAPILRITSGPLKGLEVYYGHAGADLVRVGQHVSAGQQISVVGYGIVGISTGPHLEIGFYPPGPMGGGSRMLALINSLMSQQPSGRAATTRAVAAHSSRSHTAGGPRARVATVHAKRRALSRAGTSAGAGIVTTSGGVEAPSQPATTAQQNPSDVTSQTAPAGQTAPAEPTNQTEPTAQTGATTPTAASEPTGAPQESGSSSQTGSSEAAGSPEPTSAPTAEGSSEASGSSEQSSASTTEGSSEPAGSTVQASESTQTGASEPAATPEQTSSTEQSGASTSTGSSESAGSPEQTSSTTPPSSPETAGPPEQTGSTTQTAGSEPSAGSSGPTVSTTESRPSSGTPDPQSSSAPASDSSAAGPPQTESTGGPTAATSSAANDTEQTR
jgi:murein DD-endopeptidase MepM/ murein hydrolase activator NlpD